MLMSPDNAPPCSCVWGHPGPEQPAGGGASVGGVGSHKPLLEALLQWPESTLPKLPSRAIQTNQPRELQIRKPDQLRFSG